MQCQMEVPAISGLEDGQITVGRPLLLHCNNWPEKFDFDKIATKDDAVKYTFHILKARPGASGSVDLEWTSYTTGKASVPKVILTDGEHEVDVGPLQFEVKSVIDAKEPRKEPYGPVGPLSIPMPVSIWLTAIFLLVAVVTGIFSLIRSRQRKKAWEKERQNYQIRISPIMQMYVELRRLDRRRKDISPLDQMSDVRKIFNEYLIRTFDWPVPHLKVKNVAALLKKRYRKKKILARQLSELYLKLHEKNNELTVESVQAFEKDLQAMVERMEKENKNDLA